MLRMTRDEKADAVVTIAMTLRGSVNGSSKAAVEAALAEFESEDVYPELAAEIWKRITTAVLEAGLHFSGPLVPADREQLIGTVCQRLGEALRGPAQEEV
jgi:hypothetical protein